MKQTFGQRIKHNRARLNMTQRELRKKTGLSAGFISDLENGKRQASAINLELLAKALEVSMDDLFKGK